MNGMQRKAAEEEGDHLAMGNDDNRKVVGPTLAKESERPEGCKNSVMVAF